MSGTALWCQMCRSAGRRTHLVVINFCKPGCPGGERCEATLACPECDRPPAAAAAEPRTEENR